jgi:hypothetical protein
MINIFIGLSNNQISACELILNQNNKVEHYNVLISNSTLNINKALWDEVVFSASSFNNQPKGLASSFIIIFNKIKQYKSIILKLEKFKKEKNITLYFSYIEEILTNYMLLSFNKNLQGIVVEDGTLNYYSHTLKNIPVAKRLLKWGLSNIMGIRFKLYKGHSSGIEYDHVKKQYVRVPELSLFPDKSVLLPYPERNTPLTDTVLIIGQEPYINMYGRERYQKTLKELINLINKTHSSNNIKAIYYKPHRHGQRIDYNDLKTMFEGKVMKVLDEDASLEDVYFEKLGSKFIYTFDSSALLNIYLESSVLNKREISFNVLLKYNTLLEPIFKKFNFNIYS